MRTNKISIHMHRTLIKMPNIRAGERTRAFLLTLMAGVCITATMNAQNEEPAPRIERSAIVIEEPETPHPAKESMPEDNEADAARIKEWREYIALPFSQITDKKIKQIEKSLAAMPGSRGVAAFRKEFASFKELRKELDGYWDVARRPYDFETVESTKERVFAMESRVNAAQARDIHEGLLTVLVRFRKGAITLQQIVASFEEIVDKVPKDDKGRPIRQPDTKKKLVAEFEEVISGHRESIQKRIKDNPYLRNLYSGYVDGMRMNPFNTGLRGIRNQIMSQATALPEEITE